MEKAKKLEDYISSDSNDETLKKLNSPEFREEMRKRMGQLIREHKIEQWRAMKACEDIILD